MKYDIAKVEEAVGVDVGSLHLDIAIQGKNGVRRISNTDAAISRWLKGMPAGSRVAMESTGRYHRRLTELAHRASRWNDRIRSRSARCASLRSRDESEGQDRPS